MQALSLILLLIESLFRSYIVTTSSSRHNLDSIVEAIRHLEGDHLFTAPESATLTVSSSGEVVGPQQVFLYSCITGCPSVALNSNTPLFYGHYLALECVTSKMCPALVLHMLMSNDVSYTKQNLKLHTLTT